MSEKARVEWWSCPECGAGDIDVCPCPECGSPEVEVVGKDGTRFPVTELDYACDYATREEGSDG